jgi:hypothetical protein
VRIKEENMSKKTFRTRYYDYEFVVVPFGLTNTQYTFMCLMNDIFRNYLYKFIVVFLDDILIYSKSEEKQTSLDIGTERDKGTSTILQAKQVLSLPREDSLFGAHYFRGRYNLVDSEKIEAIRGWPTPKNVLEVMFFMGLVGYYKIFIT